MTEKLNRTKLPVIIHTSKKPKRVLPAKTSNAIRVIKPPSLQIHPKNLKNRLLSLAKDDFSGSLGILRNFTIAALSAASIVCIAYTYYHFFRTSPASPLFTSGPPIDLPASPSTQTLISLPNSASNAVFISSVSKTMAYQPQDAGSLIDTPISSFTDHETGFLFFNNPQTIAGNKISIPSSITATSQEEPLLNLTNHSFGIIPDLLMTNAATQVFIRTMKVVALCSLTGLAVCGIMQAMRLLASMYQGERVLQQLKQLFNEGPIHLQPVNRQRFSTNFNVFYKMV